MSTLHLPASMFIPKAGQVAPFLAHGFIIHDRIYDIYTSPPINYNQYYQPSYERKPAIRAMSKRTVTYRAPIRRFPLLATVHYLSQLRMERHLDNIRSSKNRL